MRLSFLEKIKEKYGRQGVKTVSNHPKRKTKVEVIFEKSDVERSSIRTGSKFDFDEPAVCRAVSLGKGSYRVFYNGRKWNVRIPVERVLIQW